MKFIVQIEGEILMIRANIKKVFNCEPEKLWNIVTDNIHYSWRSDISKIEVVNDVEFIEYSSNEYPTYFTITSSHKLERYSFNLNNSNIRGRWTGLFKVLDDSTVEIDFTEEIEVNNFIMKLFAKSYLKKQQRLYIKDLERVLNREQAHDEHGK